ncbi:hypothetical protein [Klebsiella michiganensis]|uniref:hypothetical protein n=1 Tax=Klebsiella michiganensis TaxID=1134687 RepID=UPI000AD46418|nr:hypothetical protein [Klebsiella michiganensis]MDU2810487.1 hypothetical protein [Klebsiella michiganensis]MDU4798296.1 hypothetical protein [Klebsiella michiganensis]
MVEVVFYLLIFMGLNKVLYADELSGWRLNDIDVLWLNNGFATFSSLEQRERSFIDVAK